MKFKSKYKDPAGRNGRLFAFKGGMKPQAIVLCIASLFLTNVLSAEPKTSLMEFYENNQQRIIYAHEALSTADPSDPLVQQILDGLPLVVGTDGFSSDIDEGGPGYLNQYPTDDLATDSGWQSSGGGGGVLCYDSREMQKDVFSQVVGTGLLSAENIHAAELIATHERWEENGESLDYLLDYISFSSPIQAENQIQAFGNRVDEFSNMTYQDHLERIDHLVQSHSPVFFHRLLMIRKMMPLSDWIPAKLTPVPDFKLLSPMNLMPPYMTNCLHWPVVIRKFNFQKGVPNPIKVYYDPFIWEKLPELDKAMLLYHEQIYALATFIGVRSADSVRSLVRKIFSLRFWSEIQHQYRSTSRTSRAFQNFLVPVVGDYPLYFAENILTKLNDPKEGTARSWYKAYSSALLKSNEWLRTCIHEDNKLNLAKEERSQVIKKCNDRAYHQLLLGEGMNMSEELAFILVVRFAVDFQAVISSSEWFLIFDEKPNFRLDQFQRSQALKACEYIETSVFAQDHLAKNYPHLLVKSRAYCHRVFK